MRPSSYRLVSVALALLASGAPVRAQIVGPNATLPTALQAYVRASGCVVPNWPDFGYTHTGAKPGAPMVWRAAVRAAGALDLVVGCDRGHKRTALVFAAPITTSSRPVLTLELPGDPTEDPTNDGCEGLMHIAGEKRVRRAILQLPRSAPLRDQLQGSNAFLHAGIADGICESDGSNIRYWTGSKWVTLPDGYSER